MLTLKVVSTDIDGNVTTNLFYGESINHTERLEKADGLKTYTNAKYVGSLMNMAGTQEFVASHVLINDSDGYQKDNILVLPYSECFIMANGRTVDKFISSFK
jgi:hypothetical protein